MEGKTLPFKGGDIIFISCGERHLAQSAPGTVSKWHWMYFELEKILYPAFMNAPLADLSTLKGPLFMNVISSEAHPKLCLAARELLNDWQGSGPFQRERIIARLLLFAAEMRSAFQELSRTAGKREADGSSDPDGMRRLDKALERIARDYRKKTPLSKLAAACGLSQTHFRRLFKKAVGKTPLHYLNQMRVAMAMAELDGSRKPVSEIAFSCGFETLSSFNRQFKAGAGLSPRQWRRRRDP